HSGVIWAGRAGRASGGPVRPPARGAAPGPGRPPPRVVAGVPMCLCHDDEIDAAIARTNRILAEAETSPNYQQLLERGDAKSVGDILAAGGEQAIRRRLRSFADAGVTDFAARIVAIGDD